MTSAPGLAFLASSFGVSNGAGSETAHIYEGLENASNLLALSLTNSPNAPRAYLMCMVFDQDYVLIDPTAGGYDFYAPVPEAAATETQNISLEIDIPENAKYIYTYVANESAGTHVFFDDFTVKQLGVDITQTTDYYPGGSIARHWEKENYRFGYQGEYSEEDEETGFNHFELRAYDSRINRWMTPDPMRQYASPYKSMGNNWVSRVDPNGGIDVVDIDVNTGQEVARVESETIWRVRLVEQGDNGAYNVLQTYRFARPNNAGLVQFPATGIGFGRYSATPDPGGYDATIPETVGPGDHYLTFDVAAKLLGLAYSLNQSHGMTILFGDMSSSNGSDPWTSGRHHAGHGHLGNRTGIDIDFRYITNSGSSFQYANDNATTDDSFSDRLNDALYWRASQFGFHNNYHGRSGSTMPAARPASGHNNHGHLGFGY